MNAQSSPPGGYLSTEGLARKLGVHVRTCKKLIGEPWFPKPIQLGGGRLLRWREVEVDAALASHAPRREERPAEPAQLQRGKQAKLKSSGASA